MRIETRPAASEQETAAIVAALEVVFAEEAEAAAAPSTDSPRWRFSGRSWAKPIPLGRERPWA